MIEVSDVAGGKAKDTRAVRDAFDAAVAVLDDAHRELNAPELLDLGIQLEAYMEVLAARPAGCAIPA